MWVPETLAKGLCECLGMFWRNIRRAESCDTLIFGSSMMGDRIVSPYILPF
jgi:hypothetical protein